MKNIYMNELYRDLVLLGCYHHVHVPQSIYNLGRHSHVKKLYIP